MEEREHCDSIYTEEIQVTVDGKLLTYTVEREFTGEKNFEECLRNIVKLRLMSEEAGNVSH